MSVSNRPATDAEGRVSGFAPLIVVNNEVVLAAAPTNAACLSSGFGLRNGRLHKGIDLQSRPAGMVFSAGPGIIREVDVRRGYGNQVLIEHGAGVFTRYAHLEAFEPGLAVGAAIGFGQPLGRMGRTGSSTAIHLHYEVLTGAMGARGSFDLEPSDPLSWPAYSTSGV
ncbi:MAG: M23 family metallopeptidase [Pseudomonadota bacterium]